MRPRDYATREPRADILRADMAEQDYADHVPDGLGALYVIIGLVVLPLLCVVGGIVGVILALLFGMTLPVGSGL